MNIKLEIFYDKKNNKHYLLNSFFYKFILDNNLKKIKNIIKHQKKIFIRLFQIIKKAKFVFNNPPKKKIIIYDNFSNKNIEKIFNKNYVFLLRVREQEIFEIFISLKIILNILKNVFKLPLEINYFAAIISVVNPKSVITSIDISNEFDVLANFFFKKINFLLFSNQHHVFEPKKNKTKIIFYYGKKIKYLKARPNIFKNINYIPPLNVLFLKKKKEKRININICLIDKNVPGDHMNQEDINREKDYFILLEFLNKLSFKYKLNVYIAIKSLDRFIINYRLKNFKKYLSKTNYFVSSRTKDSLASYDTLQKCNIVIGQDSSMLNEAILMKKKAINFRYFVKKKNFFFGNKFAEINTNNYLEFEKKFLYLKNLSNKNFFIKSKTRQYIEFFDNFKIEEFKKNFNLQFLNEK